MEVVAEARAFARAKVHDRIGNLRSKTRRLTKLEDPAGQVECSEATEHKAANAEQAKHEIPVGCERERPASGPVCPSAKSVCGRSRSIDAASILGRRESTRPVNAFSFKTPRAPKPRLDRDGSVSSTFKRPPTSSRPQQSYRLQTCGPWRPSEHKNPSRRGSKALSSASASAKPSGKDLQAPSPNFHGFRPVRKNTWGDSGFSGLLGSDYLESAISLEDRKPEEPQGFATSAPPQGDEFDQDQHDSAMSGGSSKSDAFQDVEEGSQAEFPPTPEELQDTTRPSLSHGDEGMMVGRRLSSAEHEKWQSSFNRYRHDGEIHFDDLSSALAHCGFGDRRPAIIAEVCKQVTHFATLDRDEFISFVCLYESHLLELYRAEFTKYQISGLISVENFVPLLKQLGLEPRQVVLEELMMEVCGNARALLSFQDVATIMELLRQREGFLIDELDRFRRVFQDFDTDKSGDMSTGELVSAMGWLGIPASREVLHELYQQSDLNGNGVLSFSEFVICLRHIQDKELTVIRDFLSHETKHGYVSSLEDLEALLRCLGYFAPAAAITDALQEAGLCSKADLAILRLAGCGMKLDVDDLCKLLGCLRGREGFTDAQMDELRQAFHGSEPRDEDWISTGGELHKTLRWLGHCHTFDRTQQLIYEVDPDGSRRLDFASFVKLVRKCRDFEQQEVLAAFHAADLRNAGLLDARAESSALQQLGLEFPGALVISKKQQTSEATGMDLNSFLIKVSHLQKERLRCLRAYCSFTPTELDDLRQEFGRLDKENVGELKRHDLPRLVEALFPTYAHSMEFRPILVRLLKEVKLAESQAVKFMDFLRLVQTIREETEKHQCLVYFETVKRLDFSLREASEFLSVFLSASEEGTRKLAVDDLVNLFQHSSEISEAECKQLHDYFALTAKKGSGDESFEAPADFLDFLRIMHSVIEAGLGGMLLHKTLGDS